MIGIGTADGADEGTYEPCFVLQFIHAEAYQCTKQADACVGLGSAWVYSCETPSNGKSRSRVFGAARQSKSEPEAAELAASFTSPKVIVFVPSLKLKVSSILAWLFLYISIASGSSKNCSTPIYKIPCSSCHGTMSSRTTTIFLKESPILFSDLVSCSRFSALSILRAD